MNQKISRSFIDEIHKISTIDFMEKEYDSNFIFNRSSNWANTNCPMPNHEDNSPSFGVNSDSNLFHCFGCGAKGDIIKLVQLVEGLTFVESIQKIANFAGIEVEIANLDLKTILRELSKNVNSFFIESKDNPFPGGLSEASFLIMMAERTKNHLRKSFNNIDEMKWIDTVYKDIEKFTSLEDYKNIEKIWNDFAKNSKNRLRLLNGEN